MNFETHCQRVWSSRFFRRLGSLYWQRWPRGPWKPGKGEVVLDGQWGVEMPPHAGRFLQNAIAQFHEFRRVGFGIQGRRPSPAGDRSIRFLLSDAPAHPERFTLAICPRRITISSRTGNGLAHGLFYLERMMELRGAPVLPLGRQSHAPRFDLRLHCDVWGGYTVTPRWLPVPRRKETFLLLARHGINATQLRARLGDFFQDSRYPEISNPKSQLNLRRLRQVVADARDCGLSLILHADNFRLPPDHPLFRRKPSLKGTPIFTGVACPVCTGTREGLDLVARGWERVFREVPGLGGMIAIVGGECFTHCAMRPVRTAEGRNPCPRCGSRHSADVAAELLGAVSRRVHRVAPRARILAWPYSAECREVWNADHAEMERFIRRLPKNSAYVLEIDKDGIQPVRGAPGLYRHIWDYSSSFVGPSSRYRHQAAVAGKAGVPLCVKTESLQGWEAGFMPYLPIMDHWQRRWTLLRQTSARDIHMGWPAFGFNDAPPMELAAWQLWTPAPVARSVLDQMTARDFSPRAVPTLRRVHRLFGEALEMLPSHCMGYYRYVQFLGSAHPLLLSKDEPLDDAFLGFHFYEGEGFLTLDSSQVRRTPLVYRDNVVNPLRPLVLPRGRDAAQAAAACVRRAARAWQRALALYESVAPQIPPHRLDDYVAERRILRHLAHTWRTWANVEEFYIQRNLLEAMDLNCYSGEVFRPEHTRTLKRMLALAEDEWKNCRAAWDNLRGDPRLDLSLRLDAPTVPMRRLYAAKFRHARRVIATLERRLSRGEGRRR